MLNNLLLSLSLLCLAVLPHNESNKMDSFSSKSDMIRLISIYLYAGSYWKSQVSRWTTLNRQGF